MDDMQKRLLWLAAALAIIWGALALFVPAKAKDLGQWETLSDDEHAKKVREWFEGLMQPDYPRISCCGEADAYHADSFEVSPAGEWVAIITDTRDDRPLQRPHIPAGTKITVPNIKLKFDAGNPTGHGVIFVKWDDEIADWYVMCYVTPGGV